MGGMTQEMPKPMLPVRGKPLLEHILERLATVGIERFLLVVGYQHELIERHFQNWPGRIEFQLQAPVNGTGSAARLARTFAANELFLLTFGDILCQPEEYLRCISILQADAETAAVVAVKDVDDPWQGAAVYETGGRISRIVEKPTKGTSTTRWNSAGFYGFRPVVFDYFDQLRPSPRNEYEITSALEMMLADKLDLRISAIEGAWRDIGRPEDLAAVNEIGVLD